MEENIIEVVDNVVEANEAVVEVIQDSSNGLAIVAGALLVGVAVAGVFAGKKLYDKIKAKKGGYTDVKYTDVENEDKEENEEEQE